MVFSHSSLVGSSETSPVAGYEKFQNGIFNVSDLKSTFFMNSPEKSPDNSDRSPTFKSSSKFSSESKSSGSQLPPKQENKSPSSASTSLENGSPKTANPLQSLVPRFVFGNDLSPDFSPVSTYPDFGVPTG